MNELSRIGNFEVILEGAFTQYEEQLSQEIINTLSDAIHVIDRDFRVVLVNKAYLELCKRAGYSIDPLGKILFEIYPFLHEQVRKEYNRVFETGQIIKTDEKITLQNIDFYTETQKVPIFEDKKVVRIMTVIRDISEWKRADIFKANLIAFCSHELKTPLVPILGWTDYIKKVLDKGEDLNARVEREDLLSVTRNAERLKNIIDSYLDVGRIEAGRLVLSLEQIEISHVLVEALAAVSHLVKAKSIILRTEIPIITIYGDSFRLEQVFINLLSNAFIYSPPNTQVYLHIEDLGDAVKVSIQDEGFGFCKQDLEDAFQPFSRSYLKTKGDKIFAGSGVGLYICRRIVEAHNGSIEIQSLGLNRGTTVSVALLKDPRPYIISK